MRPLCYMHDTHGLYDTHINVYIASKILASEAKICIFQKYIVKEH